MSLPIIPFRKERMWAVLIGLLIASRLCAQNIAGDWQGTVKIDNAKHQFVLHIVSDERGPEAATLFSTDQRGFDGVPVDSITLQNSTLKWTVNSVHATYEGTLSADGNSFRGNLLQDVHRRLDFRRATWKIPDAGQPDKS